MKEDTIKNGLIAVTVLLLVGGLSAKTANPNGDSLSKQAFREPPISARPGAFWPWLNGTVSLPQMTKDGTLTWDVPVGEWDVLRFVSSNTGHQLIVPSPNSRGPMIDFLNPVSTQKHFQYLIDKILAGLNAKSFMGTSFHHMEVDSMELGEETAWTEAAVRSFKKNYGYDPLPYLAGLPGWAYHAGTGPISNEFIIFDLGLNRDLEKVRIWNYNDNARGFLDRGVKDLKILVAPDHGAFRDLGAFRLKQATQNEDKNYSEDLPLTVSAVRYVKFAVGSNQGDPRYAGLSRVKFFGREDLEGVTVKEVSSGQAFDPKDDDERAEAYPALEAVPAGADAFDLTVWKRGSYVLQDGRGKSQTVQAADIPPSREITGPWEVRFPAGWGAPASQIFPELVPWPAVDHPGIKWSRNSPPNHQKTSI
jgi:hypothetical protein